MMAKRLGLTAALLLAAWTLAACGGGELEERAFLLTIQGGALQGEAEFEVRQGDSVTFEAVSDAPGALHVHGYDLELTVSPDAPTTLAFAAHATGAYAIAFHPAAAHGYDGGAQPCEAALDGVELQLRPRRGGRRH